MMRANSPRMHLLRRTALLSTGFLLACGVEQAPLQSEGESGSGGIGSLPGDETAAPDDGATGAATGNADGTTSGGHGGQDGTDEADDGSEGGAEPTRFDVGDFPEIEGCVGNGQGGKDDFSIIWVANSPQGTVSKIDTKTATEIARYATGEGAPDPSRTSVNLRGNVAVTNRRGSVTKIAARLEDCVDTNGDQEITTSSGPADVLPWGQDECVLWNHETGFDATVAGSTGGPRATAWTGGRLDPETCEIVEAHVWVGWRNQPDTTVTLRLIDGDDGTTVGQAVVEGWLMNWGHGPYGGAADIDGNLWALQTGGGLVRVSIDDFSVQQWENPVSHIFYGLALDAEGTPWIAGYSGNLWSFDTQTEEFIDHGGTDGGPTRMRGLAIDTDGYAWIAGNNPCGLIQYDVKANAYVDGAIPLPGCAGPVGVSIDVDGHVWVVDRDSDEAYKVDPSDYSVSTVTGLVDPYTYSDMTGAGLSLVVNPPG